jgi:DNA-binding CsgD family transcriptional regulator
VEHRHRPAVRRGFLADALMEQGRLEEAAEAVARGGHAEHAPLAHAHWLLEAQMKLRLLRGDLRGGLDALRHTGRRLEEFGLNNPAFMPWRSLSAHAHLASGERDEALRLAEQELELSRSWGAPRALSISLRAAGLARGGDRGIETLREAVDVAARSPARLEHAKALVELGAALRRANRRTESRELLRNGLEQAVRCDARPLADRAESELLASGARLRRELASGVDALTPSERRVADLAAAGASNRDIAQALFVTTKTVEVHLSNSYRKLDIRSRAQLARALAPA